MSTLYTDRHGRLLQGEAAMDAEALDAEEAARDERFHSEHGVWPWEVEDGSDDC